MSAFTFQAGAYLHHLNSISDEDLAGMTAAELRLLLTISQADMSKAPGWRRVGTATVTVSICSDVAPPALRRAPLTNEQMIDAIAPLCASRDMAALLVQQSLDEYQAIERAHGISNAGDAA
jgi:hypothetical protein